MYFLLKESLFRVKNVRFPACKHQKMTVGCKLYHTSLYLCRGKKQKQLNFMARRKSHFGHDRWMAYYKTSNYTILWTGILTVTPSPTDEDNLSESCRYTTPWTLGLLKKESRIRLSSIIFAGFHMKNLGCWFTLDQLRPKNKSPPPQHGTPDSRWLERCSYIPLCKTTTRVYIYI